jgi:hypothetical protein
MDNIQESGLGVINNASSGRLRDCRIRPKGQQKLATIDPLTAEAGLEDVLVIPKNDNIPKPNEVLRRSNGSSCWNHQPNHKGEWVEKKNPRDEPIGQYHPETISQGG